MNETKKIAMVAFFPIAVLFLSGCGLKTDQAPPAQPMPTQTSAKSDSAKATAQESTVKALPPLPTDNKQAIDVELQSIDQEIQATEASLATDIEDGALGL